MPDDAQSQNRTDFDLLDVSPEEREHYRTLQNTNRGYWRGRADSANQTAIDRRERYQAIASNLELTAWQTNYGYRLLESLDLRRMGLSLDLVVLSVCALVVREDGREYYPYRSPDNNDQAFQDFVSESDLRDHEIASCMEKIRSRLLL